MHWQVFTWWYKRIFWSRAWGYSLDILKGSGRSWNRPIFNNHLWCPPELFLKHIKIQAHTIQKCHIFIILYNSSAFRKNSWDNLILDVFLVFGECVCVYSIYMLFRTLFMQYIPFQLSYFYVENPKLANILKIWYMICPCEKPRMPTKKASMRGRRSCLVHPSEHSGNLNFRPWQVDFRPQLRLPEVDTHYPTWQPVLTPDLHCSLIIFQVRNQVLKLVSRKTLLVLKILVFKFHVSLLMRECEQC